MIVAVNIEEKGDSMIVKRLMFNNVNQLIQKQTIFTNCVRRFYALLCSAD